MTEFARKLDVHQILSHVRDVPNGAVAALLENWVVFGQRPHREGKLGLRLAIRNGYVNFYAVGQSVAKLSVSSRTFKLETHRKYHLGIVKNESLDAGPDYLTFSGTDLLCLTSDDVARWNRSARTFANAEKSFVDRLLLQNSNIIDLEVALPGATAPRIDLAVVDVAEGRCTVGFWEAKCIDSRGLRAATWNNPAVFGQVERYAAWLSDKVPAVAVAYQNVAKILVELADGLVGLDEQRFGHLRKLDDSIRALAFNLPKIISRPGLVVCITCPSGWLAGRKDKDAKVKDFSDKTRSFRSGAASHEARLKTYFSPNYASSDDISLYRLPQLVD